MNASFQLRAARMSFLLTALAAVPLGAQETVVQPTSESSPVSAGSSLGEVSFSFDRTPWRDVIKWIATESGLALHFEDLPPGSFSYSDAQRYTIDTALDRLNLFLLPQGFTLVKSGQLLSLINLADPRSLQQLDALATRVVPSELDQRNEHEVVKCLFPLGELSVKDALEELQPLKLMTTPAAFQRTNQLLVTDTVAKQKSIHAILSAFQPQGLGNGNAMKSFTLQHVTAEDILLVARPHLGLATGEMIGIDVSLSADPRGSHIFVSGAEDRVKLIEALVQALDQPRGQISTADGVTELRSHLVAGGNVEMVYNVLQTLLAGKSLRLSMDPRASSIVALATPDVHNEIEQTVLQLQASEADFEVIQLNTVDPYFAITLLEEMLQLDQLPKSKSDPPLALPKIDADPGNMRLFVRGKRHEIDQIKKIVAGLDTASGQSATDLRVLPLRGKLAEQMLETAAKFWRKENPILLFPSSESDTGEESRERVVGAHLPGEWAESSARFITVSDQHRAGGAARYLTDNVHSQAPMIRCQLTPRGLLLQSEDTLALDEFERHLRTITGPTESIPSPPIVFYLQYTKPDDALRMLAELLDGGLSAKEAEAGTLVNGYVSSSGSYVGSILATRDGTTTIMAGTITVVADTRLNRLIAQGTHSDIARIEDYLSIIDKDTSIAEVRTYGRAHVIELHYTRASEVAESIRAAFAGRVAATAPSAAAGSGNPAAQGSAEDRGTKERDETPSNDDKKSTPKKSSAGQPSRSLEPTMTVAIHEASNSLIVTAPDQLVAEVQQLVDIIDSRSEQTVEILAPSNAAVLQSILQPGGSRDRSNRSSSSGNSSSRTSSSSGSSSSSQFWDMLKGRSAR